MGLINPDNLAILARHLRCAAFELPFGDGDSFGRYRGLPALLQPWPRKAICISPRPRLPLGGG